MLRMKRLMVLLRRVSNRFKRTVAVAGAIRGEKCKGGVQGEGLRTTLSTMCLADCLVRWRGNATRGA